MTTKERLLSFLEENRGSYVSGEELAEALSVTRTSVWKAVNSLRSDGYEIDSVPKRGYCLSDDTDILSAQAIQKYLDAACADLFIRVEKEVTSTNAILREEAAAGAPEGNVLIASSQTKGRGRLGRQFFSPPDTGIYMSLLLRPTQLTHTEAIKVTTMAAVAACEAIETVSGRMAGIKWVNDIYMNGKKVSGILTEASLSMESGHLDFVILGIGLNVYPPKGGFPDGLTPIAGTICKERQKDGKNRLAAEFLNAFFSYYKGSCILDYEEKYRERSLVLGKEIDVLKQEGTKRATAKAIDEACRLLVAYEDGTEEWLSSGEISVRFTKTE